VIFYWLTFITAPTALFLGLRHWNSPRSLVPRSRARLIIGTGLALLEVIGMIFFVGGLYFGWFKSR
jgi:hypothetical protein